MPKLLQTNFIKGSLQETISNSLLTNSDARFRMNTRGLAMKGDWVDDYVEKVPTSDINSKSSGYIECSFIYTGIGDRIWATRTNGGNNRQFNLTISWGNTRITAVDSSGNIVFIAEASSLTVGKTYHVVYVSDTVGSTSRVYVDSVSQSLSILNGSLTNFFFSDTAQAWDWIQLFSKSDSGNIHAGFWANPIYDFNIWDNIPTQNEIDDMYEDFLARSPLWVQTSNFTYAKPDDLSNEPDLVAWYNMIPSAWHKLIDISWNGIEWDIEWPLSITEWMNFDGVKDKVSLWDKSELELQDFTIVSRVRKTAIWATWRYFCMQCQPWLSPYWRSWAMFAITSIWAVHWYIVVWADSGESFSTVETYPAWERLNIIFVKSWTDFRVYVYGIDEGNITLSSATVDYISTLKASYLWVRASDAWLANFFDWDIAENKVYDYPWNISQIKSHNNKRARQLNLYEDFRYAKADGLNHIPLWRTNWTGSYKIWELWGLDWRSKYLENTSNGTISRQYTEWEYTWNWYVKSIEYYNWSSWSNVWWDTLDNVVTSNAWLSLSNNRLTFDLTTWKRIANIIISKWITV